MAAMSRWGHRVDSVNVPERNEQAWHFTEANRRRAAEVYARALELQGKETPEWVRQIVE